MVEKDRLLKKASDNPRETAKGKKKQPKKRISLRKETSEIPLRSPVISCAEDLIGKRVRQRFVDGDGERWYSGTVITVVLEEILCLQFYMMMILIHISIN